MKKISQIIENRTAPVVRTLRPTTLSDGLLFLVEAREGEGDRGPRAGLQGALGARSHMLEGGLDWLEAGT